MILPAWGGEGALFFLFFFISSFLIKQKSDDGPPDSMKFYGFHGHGEGIAIATQAIHHTGDIQENGVS